MARILAFLICLPLLSGCAIFWDPEKAEFEDSKVKLEREVELLLLKKRKAILEKQLDAIHETEFKVIPEAE